LRIVVVCSHGGHLTEALVLLEAFEGHEVEFVTYRSHRTEELRQLGRVHLLRNIGFNPFWMAVAFVRALWLFLTTRIDVVLSTGSEIALPYIILGRVFRKHTIFVETWARVAHPSGTARVVYPFSDLFLVQWEGMLNHCGPKAQFWGSVL